MKVFVYGTLKKGYHNNRLLSKASFVCNGVCNGSIWGTGMGFPYAKFGTGKQAYGEVWEITPDMLPAIDRLEGYREGDPDNNFYRRITVDVIDTETDEMHSCFAYEIINTYDFMAEEGRVELWEY